LKERAISLSLLDYVIFHFRIIVCDLQVVRKRITKILFIKKMPIIRGFYYIERAEIRVELRSIRFTALTVLDKYGFVIIDRIKHSYVSVGIKLTVQSDIVLQRRRLSRILDGEDR